MFFVLPKKFALNDSPYAIKKGFEVLCGSSVVGARIEVLALIPHDSRICQRKACVSAIDHVLKWIVGLTRNGSLREPTGCLGSIETVYTVNVLMHKNMGYPICSHVTSVVFCKKKHLYRFSPLDIFFLHYHLSPDRPVPILPFLLAVFEGGLCGTSSTSLYMCDRNVTTRRVWNIQTKVIPPKRGSQQNALGTGLWISDMFNELGEWLAFFYFPVSPLGSNKVLLNKQLLLNVRQLFFSFFSILIFFPQEDWKEDAFCGSAVWQLFVLQQQFLLIIKTLSWKWNDCLVFM